MSEDWETGIPWIPSPLKAIAMALALADVDSNDSLVDVGCGDGRVGIIASKYLGARSTCIEKREDLCVLAEANSEYNKVSSLYRVKCMDAMDEDYREYSVVYLYMFRSFNSAISVKLDKELRKGARVVTLDFPIPAWAPVLYRRIVDEGGVLRTVYLYVIGVSNPSSWRIRRFEGYPKKHVWDNTKR